MMPYLPHSIRISRLSLAVAGLLAASSALAQTNGTWNVNASGTWSTPGNWLGGTITDIADGAGSTADFSQVNLTGVRTVTVDAAVANRTVGTLLVGDTTDTAFAYTFAGSGTTPTLTFNNSGSGATITQSGVGGATFASSLGLTLADNLTVNNVQTITMSGVISESGGARNIVKAGSGSLVLGGTNLFTGTVTVREGTLSYSADANFGSGTSQILLGHTTGSANAALSNSSSTDITISRGIRVQSGNDGIASIRISPTTTVTHTYSGGIVLGTNGGDGHGLTLNPGTGTGFGTLHVSSTISDPTSMNAGTAGALTITAGTNSRVRLSGTNTFTGGVILSSGKLQLNSAGALGAGTLTINGGGLSQLVGAVSLNNNAMIWNADFFAEGALTTDMGTGAVNLGALGTDTTRTLNVTNTGSTGNTGFVVRGVISDGTNGTTINLTKTGAGILTLGGVSTYTGATSVTAGTLRLVTGNNRLPTGTNLSINSGATFDLNTRNQSVAGLSGSGIVQNNASGTSTISVSGTSTFDGIIRNNSGTGGTVAVTKSTGGTLTLTGTNTYTGATTITGGELSISSLADGGTASNIGQSSNAAASLVIDGGTLTYTGAATSTDRRFTVGTNGGTINSSGSGAVNFTNTNNVTLSGTNTARTFNLTGSNTGSNILRGGITDNGTGQTSIVKSGTGTWILTGTSTYTGTTQINNGALIVGSGGSGSLGNTAVTVGSSGRLGGSGTIAGSVTVSGDLNPGNSPGTLNTGALTLQNTANLNFELDALADSSDLINVTGTLTLDGTLNITNFGGLEAGNYTLINYSGSLVDNGLLFGSMASGFNYSLDTGTANQIILNVTAVPEPTTTLLLAIGLTALVARRKRVALQQA